MHNIDMKFINGYRFIGETIKSINNKCDTIYSCYAFWCIKSPIAMRITLCLCVYLWNCHTFNLSTVCIYVVYSYVYMSVSSPFTGPIATARLLLGLSKCIDGGQSGETQYGLRLLPNTFDWLTQRSKHVCPGGGQCEGCRLWHISQRGIQYLRTGILENILHTKQISDPLWR